MKADIVLSVLNFKDPIIKLALPVAGIAIILLLSRKKWNISPVADLKLVAPAVKPLVFWAAANVAWMLVTDYFLNWRGEWDFTTWQTQPFYASVLRFLAVCFAGPILEELVFRGILFFKLHKRYPDKPWIIVVLLAAIWALIHYDYTPAVIFIIFIEGILLGAALLKSRSLYVPIAMHICWNLYAIW